MTETKKLINRTGKELKVILSIRKSDQPMNPTETVVIYLSAAKGSTEIDSRSRDVSCEGGVYLDGIETFLLADGAILDQRKITVERGKGLDKALNSNDTIEFLFDGERVMVSATHSGNKPFLFPTRH